MLELNDIKYFKNKVHFKEKSLNISKKQKYI